MGRQKKDQFDKYQFYCDAVQEPEPEIRFLKRQFRKLRGRSATLLREDFCGTGYLSCEWVKQGVAYSAIGIDHDPDAIQYGKAHHYAKLSPLQQSRMQYLQRDVLRSAGVKADIIAAFNFSYWVFQERKVLLRYFRAARRSLKRGGLFFLDAKGGDEVVKPRVERTQYPGYTYYWECESFDPVTHECLFSIHFKLKGQRMRRRVFTYHWRYWALPEIRDLLAEAGFSKTIVYWEGDAKGGRGNGVFKPVKKAEDCHIWLTYIAAIP